MMNILLKIKKESNKKAKEAVLKEFFNSTEQKKAIAKAARESARDQRMLIEKYHKMVKVGQ